MSETFELTAPVDLPPSGIPTTYDITDRPSGTPRPASTDPELLAALVDTLQTRKALSFPCTGYGEREMVRLAARLNAIGRNPARDFTVRTRKKDGRVFAWAVPKQHTAKQPRQKKAAS